MDPCNPYRVPSEGQDIVRWAGAGGQDLEGQVRHRSCQSKTGDRLRRPGGGSLARQQAIVFGHHHLEVQSAWENFKGFNRDAIVSIVTHALVVVRPHYPAIDL